MVAQSGDCAREAAISTRFATLRSRPAWAPSTLLGRLRPEARDQLLQLGVERDFPRNHSIIRHGDYADRAVLLIRGTAKVITSSEDGRLALLGVARAGDLADEITALYHLECSANVITCGPATVRLIDAGSFQDFLRNQPDAHFAVTQMVAERLREANRRRADYVLPVPCRLARVLIELADHIGRRDTGGRYELPDCLTQAELGSLAGMARRTVEEQLRELQRQGIVELAYRRMTINDIAALYTIARLPQRAEPPVASWQPTVAPRPQVC
jgi:CRP/FNR family transcriptional regulator, cyclic AMP receptor protein